MIDFKKYIKHSKPGPRYTSYPTAVEFNNSFKYYEYINKLKNTNKSLSLYFHFPFCKSACYFCACNVVYTSSEKIKKRYIAYLKKELNILKDIINPDCFVEQIHFGGGTPTFYSALQLKSIIEEIKKTFKNISKEAEISCEIDPRYFNEEQMKVLSQGGFNRLSFGVQDFNTKVQEAVNRSQSFEISQNSVYLARKYNMKSVNIDLIYGLPLQKLEDFKKTLEKIKIIDPNRIAVFNYAHVPWIKKSMQKIKQEELPSLNEKLNIFKYTIDYLNDNGYISIGMDHFAKSDDELFKAIKDGSLHRNFQGYTTKKNCTLIGVGLSSIGEGEDYYSQNFKDLKTYEKAIDAKQLPLDRGIKLNENDKIRKYIIMELMSNFKLDIKKFESKFTNINFKEHFKNSLKELKPLLDDGLVKIDDNYIKADKTGAMVIRNVAMVFDAYLEQSNKEKVFSKTV